MKLQQKNWGFFYINRIEGLCQIKTFKTYAFYIF